MKLRIPATVPEPPPWASTFGVDEYGVFAGINVKETVQMFRWIEPGTFQMGSPDDERGRWEDEGPQHEVMIPSGFWLGETPVTQAFYETVAGKNPSHFTGNVQRPVEQVSWQEAVAFCERLKKLLSEFEAAEVGLPTEAQWEFACRAASTAPLYSGLELTGEEGACPNVDALAWYGENSGNTTHPVGEKLPNGWGLYDMLGNVEEWCEDAWHENYESAPTDGSA